MSRDEFDKYFPEYRKYLREEIHRFRDHVAVYRHIQNQKDKRLDIVNLAPAFFGMVESALFTSIVLWADKLFDEKGECGLFNFLTFIEYNRKWLVTSELQRRRSYPDDHWMLKNRTPITLESIEEDRQKIRSLEALKSFRLRRDKFHGHFDKNYFFDRKRLQNEAPIKMSDLNEAGKVMGGVLNDYSVDFDGNSYAWESINIDDIDHLLRKAERGIKGRKVD